MNFQKKHIVILVVVLLNFVFGYTQDKSRFIKKNGGDLRNAMIAEDELGYIWIKGPEGLIKFDGYNFNLNPYPSILSTDSNSDIGHQFAKDSQGNLWLSSVAGDLLKIDKDGNYTSFKENTKYANISCISSVQNTLWFGSEKGSLFNYDHSSKKLEEIAQLPKLNNASQLIRSIVGIDSNTVWISTFSGKVYSFSKASNTLTPLLLPELAFLQEVKLSSDPEGYLWMATESRGLLKYNLETNKVTRKYGEIETRANFSKYAMFISIMMDRSGIIWASTDGDGLYKINTRDNHVSIFKNNSNNDFSISNNTIISVYEDRNRNIWAISKKGEINILPKNNASINYFSGSEDNTPVKILSLLKSQFDKSLWLGTDGNGLNRVFANNTVINYDNLKKDNSHFEGKYILNLLEDDKDNIWIATYQNGLWVYNTRQNTFSKIETTDSEGNQHLDIRYLFKDSKNRIWLSYNHSLHIYSSDQLRIASFNFSSTFIIN